MPCGNSLSDGTEGVLFGVRGVRGVWGLFSKSKSTKRFEWAPLNSSIRFLAFQPHTPRTPHTAQTAQKKGVPWNPSLSFVGTESKV